MSDSVSARIERVFYESRAIREQRRALSEESERAILDLRRSILESASARAEIRAQRENRKE